jgi:YihY family inner membrane protein
VCIKIRQEIAVTAKIEHAESSLTSYNVPSTPSGHNARQFCKRVLLISLLFAAIYKVLPDRHLQWRDVILGAVVTAVLFTIGKALIGWYIGSSAVASSYGAAGALIVLLLWVYYSAQIFLLGAEFTKVFTEGYSKTDAGHAGRRT